MPIQNADKYTLWEIIKKLFTVTVYDFGGTPPGTVPPAQDTQLTNPLVETAVILVVAFIIGGIMALVYILTQRRESLSVDFAVTLALLPPISGVMIMLIGDNIGRAFSLGGLFAMVRFRSMLNGSKDLGGILFAMGVGLAAGLKLMSYSVMIGSAFVIFTLIIWGIKMLTFGRKVRCTIRIAVPEHMCWEQTFEDILREYSKTVKLKRIRTMEMGSYFELMYEIVIPGAEESKEMLDEIRAHNGNLAVILNNYIDVE